MLRARPIGLVLLLVELAVALGLSAARLVGEPVPAGALIGLAAAIVVTIGVGVARAGSGVFARPIVAGDAARAGDRFAITFDDGPDPLHTPSVLSLLAARGHRATFFVIGDKAAANRSLLDEITRQGHGLGNHSLHHAWRTPLLPAARLAAELAEAGALLAAAAGREVRWFRPPVGLISPPVAAAAARAGLELVHWTATARDGVAGATTDAATARLVGALRPGAILVLHDAAEQPGRTPIAAAVLARLLDEAERRGLRSVTLDELLGD